MNCSITNLLVYTQIVQSLIDSFNIDIIFFSPDLGYPIGLSVKKIQVVSNSGINLDFNFSDIQVDNINWNSDKISKYTLNLTNQQQTKSFRNLFNADGVKELKIKYAVFDEVKEVTVPIIPESNILSNSVIQALMK